MARSGELTLLEGETETVTVLSAGEQFLSRSVMVRSSDPDEPFPVNLVGEGAVPDRWLFQILWIWGRPMLGAISLNEILLSNNGFRALTIIPMRIQIPRYLHNWWSNTSGSRFNWRILHRLAFSLNLLTTVFLSVIPDHLQ